MPYPSLSFRSELAAPMRRELDAYTAQMTGFLAQAHNTDGTLGGVTAGTWTDYAMVWTGSSSNPDLADGAQVARYTRMGQTVHAKIRLAMGTNTTYGGGFWTFSLPVAADPTEIDLTLGSVKILDVSTQLYSGAAYALTTTTAVVGITGATTALGTTVPFTWASGDTISMNMTYEAGT